MAGIRIKKISNANVYVNGTSWLGCVSEAQIPEVAATMTDHKALGMLGKIQLPTGYEAMEATLKWSSFDADAMRLMGNSYEARQYQLRGSVDVYTGGSRTAEEPAVITLTAQAKNFPAMTFTQNEAVELE